MVGTKDLEQIGETSRSQKKLNRGPKGPAAVVSENERNCYKIINLILDAFRLHGFEGPCKLDLTLVHWVRLSDEVGPHGWMKVAKYKMAAFFAYWLAELDESAQLTLPPAPFSNEIDYPDYLIGARGRGFVRRMAREARTSGPRAFLELLSTILIGVKKGCPRADSGMLADASIEAFNKLTKAPREPDSYTFPFDWGDESKEAEAKMHPEIMHTVNRFTVLLAIRRTVEELFPEEFFDVDATNNPMYFPSTSANYNNSRSGGGCVGALFDSGVLKGDPVKVSFSKRRENLETRVSVSVPVAKVGKSSFKMPITTGFEEKGEYIENDEQEEKFVYDSSDLRIRYQEMRGKVMKLALSERQLAELVPLAEALKVRVISKGPPMRQYLLKPLQKRLWTVLHEHPAFRLIGEPISEEYVLERMGAKLPDSESYLSGDFADATNEMFSWVSEMIARCIAMRLQLSDSMRDIFIASLVGHTIKYGDDEAPQVRGQLMGSITSFPVLCIANAALSRWALEFGAKRRFTLADARLAINGDDIIMRTNTRGYEFWRHVTGFCGLRESVGKSYFSRLYLNMNSMPYLRVEGRQKTYVYENEDFSKYSIERPCPFQQLSFVNFGLVTGMKRSQGVLGADSLAPGGKDTLGARCRAIIETAPVGMEEKLLKLFIKHHRPALTAFKLPWFIPEWLGGVGLPPIVKLNDDLEEVGFVDGCGPSDRDLRVARQILLNWKVSHPMQIPAAPSWLIHKRVMTRLPVSMTTLTESEEKRFSKLYAELCVSELFSASELSDVYDDSPQSTAIHALRHNERIWNPSKWALPSPIDVKSLVPRKVSRGISVLAL